MVEQVESPEDQAFPERPRTDVETVDVEQVHRRLGDECTGEHLVGAGLRPREATRARGIESLSLSTSREVRAAQLPRHGPLSRGAAPRSAPANASSWTCRQRGLAWGLEQRPNLSSDRGTDVRADGARSCSLPVGGRDLPREAAGAERQADGHIWVLVDPRGELQ